VLALLFDGRELPARALRVEAARPGALDGVGRQGRVEALLLRRGLPLRPLLARGRPHVRSILHALGDRHHQRRDRQRPQDRGREEAAEELALVARSARRHRRTLASPSAYRTRGRWPRRGGAAGLALHDDPAPRATAATDRASEAR
jgi:hypothetical protein